VELKRKAMKKRNHLIAQGVCKEAEKGQAPKDVDRVDKPHVPGQKPHVHFKDGTSMNKDGTTHDAHKGVPKPSNKTQEWLDNHGLEKMRADLESMYGL